MSDVSKRCDLVLTDGTKLVDAVDEITYARIADVVAKDACNATLAYLCHRNGVLDKLNCECRISPLDGREVNLCSYERSKFFEIVKFSLSCKMPLFEAERLLKFTSDTF